LSDFYEMVELPRIPDQRGTLTDGRSWPARPVRDRARLLPVRRASLRHACRSRPPSFGAVADRHLGSFDVNLDNGFETTSVHLDRPYRGLLLRPMMWRTIDNFSDGAMCLVLASILTMRPIIFANTTRSADWRGRTLDRRILPDGGFARCGATGARRGVRPRAVTR
jgi:hypothetical protein